MAGAGGRLRRRLQGRPAGETWASDADHRHGRALPIGGLIAQALVRLQLEGDRVKTEERIEIGARVRDVAQGPDGSVYLITDESNGKLLRLTPAG